MANLDAGQLEFAPKLGLGLSCQPVEVGTSPPCGLAYSPIAITANQLDFHADDFHATLPEPLRNDALKCHDIEHRVINRHAYADFLSVEIRPTILSPAQISIPPLVPLSRRRSQASNSAAASSGSSIMQSD